METIAGEKQREQGEAEIVEFFVGSVERSSFFHLLFLPVFVYSFLLLLNLNLQRLWNRILN